MSKKIRGGGPSSKRVIEAKDLEVRILIVCEGEKTEPNYFKAFRVSSRINVLIEVLGIGKNTMSVVNDADTYRKNGDFDQIWCVFDKDSFTDQSFNAAISSAISRGIGIAYSNECFELWYILHFEYLTSSLSRKAYMPKITQLLGFKYEKNSLDMYSVLLPHQNTAIRNAKKLLAEYKVHNPAQDNPCTTVFMLVEELNKHRKD